MFFFGGGFGGSFFRPSRFGSLFSKPRYRHDVDIAGGPAVGWLWFF